MWKQANQHYKRNGNIHGREVAGVVLSNKSVLVLPDYKNDNETSYVGAYGYEIIDGRTLTKGNERLSIIGQVHTHQDKSLPAEASFYTGDGYGDMGFSLYNNSLPVFTMGHDGKLHGIRGYGINEKQPTALPASLNANDKSLSNLLKGTTTLSSIIKRLPKLVK